MGLCGTGCQYLNPKFDGATSGTSESSEGDESLTPTSDITSGDPTSPTTMSPTTGYDTTSGTIDGDLPVDSSDSTVDSVTVTGSTSTSGTESSTDPSETEGETEDPLCAPNDPPQEFAIHVFDELDQPFEAPCGESIDFVSKADWNNDRINLEYCNPGCEFCESSGYSVAVHYPNGSEAMKLTPANLPNNDCTEVTIRFNQPYEGFCVPSSIVVTNIDAVPNRHYIAVNGSPLNPAPGLLALDIEPPENDCGSCEEECCILEDSGPHVISFEDAKMGDLTPYLAEGAVGNFVFDERTAAAKNIMATSHELCDEIPQQLAWIVTTLPDL